MKKERLIHGWGIIDVDYVVTPSMPKRLTIFRTGKVDLTPGKTFWCPAYAKYREMIRRCKSERELEKRPTYVGSEVCDEWRSFAAFRDWFVGEDFRFDNFCGENFHLDKDLLAETMPGKIYSPATCLLVPPEINSFFTDSGSARGDLPLGVCLIKGRYRTKPYRAKIKRGKGKSEHIGMYACPWEAHRAWADEKLAFAIHLTKSIPNLPRLIENRLMFHAVRIHQQSRFDSLAAA